MNVVNIFNSVVTINSFINVLLLKALSEVILVILEMLRPYSVISFRNLSCI